MSRGRYSAIRTLALVSLVVALVALVACGDEATSTPLPTSTPTTVPPTLTPTPTPTSAPTPTPTPAFATSEVDRLVIAMGSPQSQGLLPWIVECGNAVDVLTPMYESLIYMDPTGSNYEGRLAVDWEMRPDGQAWSMNLREDVPWHWDFGTFSAEDVVHTWTTLLRDEGIPCDREVWRTLLNSEQDFEIDGSHMTFNLAKVEPDLDYRLSNRVGNFFMISKSQWDGEGKEGMEVRPAGTGPYRFVEFEVGDHLLYERVENHWRVTPEFKELLIRYVDEDATRLAQMLAEEIHITSLPGDLYPQVLDAGMRVLRAPIPGTIMLCFFGGLYYSFPGELDPDNPFLNIKVREAMNRAIDKGEIMEALFSPGRATPGSGQFMQPTEQGWDPAFPAVYEELYGYDPDRARELLVEAGYPDGFKTKMEINIWPGLPELTEVMEAVGGYFKEVGINVDIQDVDFGISFDAMRDREYHNTISCWPPFSIGPIALVGKIVYHLTEGYIWTYTSSFIDERYEELTRVVEAEERSEIQRQMNEHLLRNYSEMPLMHVLYEYTINPSVVEDYVVPGGSYSSLFTHMEYITAAK